ncbi:contact-dependent growth inhibition system immunity protein [Brevibacillus reuszeri]|uniref:contact-dependent growth inhibition system immunity protein n=1 Tax=Brevibacillus reuszeri TaxID=54915 RepID=UPI003D203D63
MNLEHDLREFTLDDIASREGFTAPFIVDEEVLLSKWYGAILKEKLKDLSDGDIAKLIRQSCHLTYIIPEALYRLLQNPIAGELYDAEILICMTEVNEQFWEKNDKVTSDVREFLIKIKEGCIAIPRIQVIIDEEPEEISEIVDQFEKKISSYIKGY